MHATDVFEVWTLRVHPGKRCIHCYAFSKRALCLISHQRHFSVFAVNFPPSEAQTSIYGQILCGHLKQQLFSPMVQKSVAAVVQASITLHHKMVHNFLPTAIKFHYTFNLRDISNVFQVVLRLVTHYHWNYE